MLTRVLTPLVALTLATSAAVASPRVVDKLAGTYRLKTQHTASEVSMTYAGKGRMSFTAQSDNHTNGQGGFVASHISVRKGQGIWKNVEYDAPGESLRFKFLKSGSLRVIERGAPLRGHAAPSIAFGGLYAKVK